MSENTPSEDIQSGTVSSRVLQRLHHLREWASVHWLRNSAVAALMIILVMGTICGWVYVSSLAVEVDVATLDDALAYWDQRNGERVKDVIRDLQRNPGLEAVGLGGPLFVLGAVKTLEAEKQTSEARRQAEYLVASRYLEEARTHGFPPQREGEGLYLLGRSLVASHQFREAIDTLGDALQADAPEQTPIHTLLARAHFASPASDLEAADRHVVAVLADSQLSPEERADAVLLRAEILARQQRFKLAQEVLSSIPPDSHRSRWVDLLTAQVMLDESHANAKRARAAGLTASADVSQTVGEALQRIQDTADQDVTGSPEERRAMFLVARAREIVGDADEAAKLYTTVRKAYPGTAEGMAAAMSEAELLQADERPAEALAAFRRILERIEDPATYRNPLMPLTQLRERMSQALTNWQEEQIWDEALALVDEFTPLFDPIAAAELRAKTLESRGEAHLVQAHGESVNADVMRRTGRRYLREAGTAYERLAHLRFASAEYATDLWNSSKSFFRGQSFSHTVRVLDEYLRQEPERRNPQALLRLGQAHLALGHVDPCILALSECIDFHPFDAAAYQARIDCAKAYIFKGELGQAEELLRDNLSRSALTPQSPEWRDSLFELGRLLHERAAYDEAIHHLEEAIQRYTNAEQTLPAHYLVAESHRMAAEQPLVAYRQSRAPSDREKHHRAATAHLLAALKNYRAVQRQITLSRGDRNGDEAAQNMLRNCHMLQGSVLFDLDRFDEALLAYSTVAALYQDEPFVLETLVQIANCWRRLNRREKARGAIQQAQLTLDRFPGDVDFLPATNFNREQWRQLLAEMGEW